MVDPEDKTSRVIACAGPPACTLQLAEAFEAQVKGCPWCTVYTYDEHGNETVKGPHERIQ